MDACLDGGESQPILIVDVGDDRDRASGHDLGETLGGLDVVAGDANDVGTSPSEGIDLGEGAVDIRCFRSGHRLDGYR
jgi:hypothetical protein